jgi:hypothetical protein
MTEDFIGPAPDALSFPISPGVLAGAEIRDLLGKDAPVILDIGANCGQTTAELLEVLPRATIFASAGSQAIAKTGQHQQVQLRMRCQRGMVRSAFIRVQVRAPNTAAGSIGSITKPRSHLQAGWVRFGDQGHRQAR